METETTLPIFGSEHSATGNNAYYLNSCVHTQHRPAYCACLNKIAERKKGRLESFPECSAAIGRKDCPALAMKKEEELAGKAIYFISRTQLRAEMQAAAEARGQVFARMAEQGRDWTPSKSKRSKTTTAPVKPSAPAYSGVDYAAAINAAMAKASAAASAAASTVGKVLTSEATKQQTGELKSVSADLTAPKPTTGMSMLDFARMARRTTQAAVSA